MQSRMIRISIAVALAAISIFWVAVFVFGQAPAAPQGGGAPQAGAPNAQRGGGGGGGQRGGGGGGGGGRGGGGRGAAQPTPRREDGSIILGQVAGGKGLWHGPFTIGSPASIPYQPWAQAVVQYRRVNELEPHARCKQSGAGRQFVTPYGVDFIDLPEAKRIYIMYVGGPHTFKTIYMDGREHPKNFEPTYYGHSIGHWEGDSLVVDTVGYNEKFWLDRSTWPHTDGFPRPSVIVSYRR